jgi:fibronectin-binding autotransporter adhesin
MKSRLQTLLFLAPIFIGSHAGATTISWTGTTSTDWTLGSNWGGTAPANDLTTDIALFNLTSYPNLPNAGASRSINGIQIGDGVTTTAAITGSGTALSIGASGIDMRANAGAATFNSAITLGAAQTWNNSSTSLLTVSGAVGGSFGLTKSGAGEIMLSGGATYTGPTAINQGTLTFKAPSNAAWTLGGGTKTIASGAKMKVDFSAQTTQFTNTNLGAVVINGDLDLTGSNIGVAGFYNINGLTASGAGNINITGGSMIINSNAALNNFTGAININSGYQFSFQGGTTSTTGTYSVNVASGATFDLRTEAPVMGALNGSGNTIKSFNGFAGTLTIGNGGANGNYSGTMSDQPTVYNVTKTGAGTQILSATNSTYSGVTTVNQGVLSVTTLKDGGTASSIGDSSNVAANLVINGGTLKYTGGVQSTNRNFTIGTNGGTLDASGSGALTITGAPTMTGGTTRTLTLTGTNAGANTLQGAIGNGSGDTSLVKNGDGTWILSAASHGYTGTTTVTAGKLVINGNVSTATTVNGTGTLGGTGTVGALTVASGGTLAPGNSAGILNAGNTSLQALSNFDVELNGNILGGPIAGTDYDRLNVAGTVSLAGALNLTIGSAPVDGELFFILANNNLDAITGTFSNALVDDQIYTLGGQQFQISYNGDSDTSAFNSVTGNDVVLMAVPEPAAALLGGLGLLALLRRRRA